MDRLVAFSEAGWRLPGVTADRVRVAARLVELAYLIEEESPGQGVAIV